MPDLLGPANATNATTTRASDSRIFPGTDTWFRNCTSPSGADGTILGADYLNGMLAQVRRAIRGMAVTENNSDDDMLLKAIQASVVGYVAENSLFSNMPIHGHVGTNGYIGTTVSTGQIIVNASQSIIRRGTRAYNTSDLSVGNRTFVTAVSKTYHLRWYAPGIGRATPSSSWPAGRLYLEDLADASFYNPSALAETNSAFDSTYDNLLLARVVTSSGNVLTVTGLLNQPFMYADLTSYLDQGTPGAFTGPNASFSFSCAHSIALNWARTPKWTAPIGILAIGSATGGDFIMSGRANDVTATTATRYTYAATVAGDWLEPPPTLLLYSSRLNIKVIA